MNTLLVLLVLATVAHCQNAEPVDLLVESANGNFHIVEQLLQENPMNPNLKDSAQYTPLIYATKAGRASTVDALLAAGADPDDTEGDGWSAQLFAVFAKQVEIISSLADAGANPFIENTNGVNAIALASERGDSDIVSILQAALPRFEKRRNDHHEKAALAERLVEAARNGDEAEMRALIDMGVDVFGTNDQGWTALTFAAGAGSVANVKMLLKAHSNPNYAEIDGWTPLMFAAYRGHAEVCDVLLTAGASATTRSMAGVTAVGAAKLNPDNHGMFVKRIADHALFESMKLGDAEIAVEAIDNGGDVHITNTMGWSPLILFVSYRMGDAVNRLINYCPSALLDDVLNHQEQDGWTALMFATHAGANDIVAMLLDAGANPNVANFNGESALSLAAKQGNQVIVDVLLSKGAINNLHATSEDKERDASLAREEYAVRARARAIAEQAAKEAAEVEAARNEKAEEDKEGVMGFIKSFF